MSGGREMTSSHALRTVVVMGSSGGVGTTRAAVTLARAARRHSRGACIFDLDLWTGDAARRSGCAGTTTSIADLAAMPIDEITDEHVAMLLWKTSIHGVFVLPSPQHPELAEIISASHVAHVTSRLGQMHGMVIVDAGSRCDERSIAAAQQSDAIVILAPRRSDRDAGIGVLADVFHRGAPDVRVVVAHASPWASTRAIERSTGVPGARISRHRGLVMPERRRSSVFIPRIGGSLHAADG